ncbi:MAG: alpha/beta hydrolase [Verrucomicrobia bacterium]|nr:alpha/beta hydrolase [Verrucomicrobiota bacterium]MBU4290751.1 alpha/beta hydrolase [Verrucomicrobiota bacterium]MBU4428684.1 alpha/beta hydrolase [Verrucomicrobiota bacterium]MCG2679769.1 alpha/beta hydrolase [Kiritimatiellia bacterium]
MKIISGKLEQSLTQPAPSMACYLPAPQRQNGVGLIIFPGGGYGGLAEHEGKGYAEYFMNAGLSCFVVTYRLGSQGCRHPAMLEDALSAIYTIRTQAHELGVNPAKIGVIGSSAGGHLAAHALVGWSRYDSSVSLRPDFGILCYSVITMQGEFCHKGSRANLLGPDPAATLTAEVSCERQVTPQTPPCFLWHTEEDAGVPVENSMLFAAALRKSGVPFELHVYGKGRHGLGLNAGFPWAEECLRWLASISLDVGRSAAPENMVLPRRK